MNRTEEEEEIKLVIKAQGLQWAENRIKMMIGSNSLDSGIGYTPLRKFIFKRRKMDIRKWKKYINAYSHPPSGKLLALWLLPKREINKMLKIN